MASLIQGSASVWHPTPQQQQHLRQVQHLHTTV
jgi:hypothetical protein